MKDKIQDLLDIAPRTYYLWKKEGRPIIEFLEKYFTSDDIEEFLHTHSISKLETINYFLAEQSESFFNFYKNIDGLSNSWRIFHLELATEKLKYDDVTDFSNDCLKSSISFYSDIHNYFAYLKLIKELTPTTIWFINMIKKNNQIIWQNVSNRTNRQIADVYYAAFDLRTGLSLNNETINFTPIDKNISENAWIEARNFILHGLDQIFDCYHQNQDYDFDSIALIINKMIDNLGDERYFHTFEGF